MPDTKTITELTALTTSANNDVFPIVDVSDTTDSAQGTTKKITAGDLAVSLGTGDVVGPVGATDEDIAVYDGATGKKVKDGGKTIAETLARANHTGTQASSTISDFDTEVSNNTDVAANTTHRGLTNNPHSVDKNDVGLGNVPNVDTTNASNISSGTLPSAVLPPIALTDVSVVASEVAQLALTAEEGDVAIRSDESKSYVHNGGTAGSMLIGLNYRLLQIQYYQ